MTVTDEAVEAAVQAYQKQWSVPPVRLRDMLRAALEAASPHMLSAPEGVSEAEKRLEALGELSPGAFTRALVSSVDLFELRQDVRYILCVLSSERERAERAERGQRETNFLLALALERARQGLVCDGCGSSWTMEALHARGAVSCCPERKMLTARQWRDRAQAAEAKVKEAGELFAKLAKLAKQMKGAAKLVGPREAQADHKLHRLWAKWRYEDGKALWDLVRPAAALRWTETQGEGE